jgi:hypothetical protein
LVFIGYQGCLTALFSGVDFFTQIIEMFSGVDQLFIAFNLQGGSDL